MHIVFNAWFWDQHYTGSGQYLRQLVVALSQLRGQLDSDLRLTLVVPRHKAQPDGVPAGVDVIPASVPMGGQIGKTLFEQVTFPAAAAKANADIAHVPYWAAPMRSPTRLIVTIHDVIPLSMPVYQGSLTARLYFSLVTATADGAGHVITDSEFSRQEIAERIGIPLERITAIPLAQSADCHPRIGSERDSEIRERYKLPEDYTLYMGSFDVRKNVQELLAAYTYVGPSVGDDHLLVLAGRQPLHWGTPRFPDLPTIVKQYGLEPFIRWIGAPDERDKPGIYRMARTFVYPSRYEGFGLQPLEAMACGTPVVAADTSSIPEVVGDAAYLVDPDDARKMGGAILATLLQNDLHESLRNHGLARASNFSWQRTARETLAVYRQVMEQN